MKKTLSIFALLILATLAAQGQVCCPEFKLVPDMQPCDTTRPYSQGGVQYEQEGKCGLLACKRTTQTYRIVPADPNYTYTWSITGGTAASTTGNPVRIAWGNGEEGMIRVIIRNTDGSCRDTLEKKICLKDAPVAGFSFSPGSTVCLNQAVQFTNASTGATSYYWDFGDGSSSSLANPIHQFTTPGTYTVTLVVNNSPPPVSQGPVYEMQQNCGCRDTIRQTITVRAESGIEIISGCKKMLCRGDTATYCTTNACSNYSWSVTGGRITGPANGKCITVIWDGSYPATVTLAGNCGGSCGNSGTINVPVLYPSLPIQGNTIVCPSSFDTYTLPAMPGTFYSWELSGGGTIVGADSNTSVINVLWENNPGDYTLTCNYRNPVTKCSGSATLTVSIKPKFQVTGPAIRCAGNMGNYLAADGGNANWTIAPAAGYTPSGPLGNTPAIGINWTTAGNYTITAVPVTPGNYCKPSATINTVVNPMPVLNTITGSTIVCASQLYNYTVSSNTSGGSFSWSFTSGTGTIAPYGPGNSSAAISFTGPGPWTLQVSQNVNGCTGTTTLSITHMPAPPPITIAPSNTTCSGGTVTVSVTGSIPAGGYTWSSTPGAVLTGGQGTASSTFTVNSNATITLSSCGGNSTINVTTTATPVTITQSAGACSAVLTASPGGGTYNWFFNGNPAGSGNPLTVTQNGLYTVEAHYGSCIATSQITVTGITPVTASISAIGNLCNGGSVMLQAPVPANCPGATFTWSNGATGNPITVTAPGSYSVTIHCSNGCSATSNVIAIGSCQGGNSGCINDLTISPSNCPNPVSLTTNNPPGCTPTFTTWYFGDSHSNTTGMHTYINVGAYPVYAVMTCSNGTKHCGTQNITIPMVDSFTSVVSCGTNGWAIQLQDASLYLPAYAGYSRTWATNCGTLSATSTSNPVLTVSPGCSPTVTLTISKNGCTLSKSFTFHFPTAPLAINGGPAVCKDVPATFSSSNTTGILTYAWNFGDGTSGVTNPISHAYNGIPANPVVSLTVTDQYGCTFTATKNIIVNTPLPLTITPGPLVKICPDCTTPATLSTNPTTGFTGYQWYQNGSAIAGATGSVYQTCQPGTYYVTATASNNNCPVRSDTITVVYNAAPFALIEADDIQCTSNVVRVKNTINEPGVTYSWTATGPAAVTFSPVNSYNPAVTIAGSAPGEYQVILTATNTQGCIARDTLCITLVKSPTVTVTAPAGPLCEEKIYSFSATAAPDISPQSYFYQWSNGASGNTISTGQPGMHSVTVQNPSGCTATAFAGSIKNRPDIGLFPAGCDTLCLTDTLWFPLPQPAPSAYTINWYDNDGTAVTNVGNGPVLPLSNLQPGAHHFYAIVSLAGGCADTTGTFDLYIRDCNLPPPCDNCTGLLQSATLEANGTITNGNNVQVIGQKLTLTILKPVKEVRISLADLSYYWKDTTCNNCKIQMIERGCLFTASANQALGTLLPDSSTAANTPASTAVNNCPGELIWRAGTLLQPGTYTIPLQLSLPKTAKDKCQLILEQLCLHVTLIDEDCKTCDTRVCQTDTGDDDCRCNGGNVWTGLYLQPQKPGIAAPRNQILCNNTLTGFVPNTPYTLSGVYHCQGNCASVKNEITVTNQQNQIIYTRVATALHETIIFPDKGMYTVTLTAHCGIRSCICSFRVYIADTTCTDCTPKDTCTNCPPPVTCVDCPTSEKIDSVIKTVVPPDFNGGILISKNDTIIYERYISYKDSVTAHTAFDLASITKTFTAMAILKLMEENKLGIDDAVMKYLPEFPFPDITIKMLLSHKSGLEDYLKFMDESGWDKTRNVSNKDLLQFIVTNKSKVLIHQPGKVFDYSNTNFALLSLIIEKVSGQSYRDYLSATFFKPLQMNDTYVLGLDNFATATPSYYKNGTKYKLRYLDLVYGDKNVYSTVQDLRKWDKALRSGKLFKKSTLDLAYAPTTPLAPFVSNYGLGWKKIVTDNGKEILYHTGWWAGNRSILIRLLEENTVIAVVSNNNFTNIADIRKLCDLFGDYRQSNKKITGF